MYVSGSGVSLPLGNGVNSGHLNEVRRLFVAQLAKSLLTPTPSGLHNFRWRMSFGCWLPFTPRCNDDEGKSGGGDDGEEDGARTYISGSKFTYRAAAAAAA